MTLHTRSLKRLVSGLQEPDTNCNSPRYNREETIPLLERLKTGLEEAILHAEGKITLKATVLKRPDPPPQVQANDLVRLRLESGLSQAVFARMLNVSTKTIQSWEQGQRRPSQSALRLIQVFRQDPYGLLKVVGMTNLQAKSS